MITQYRITSFQYYIEPMDSIVAYKYFGDTFNPECAGGVDLNLLFIRVRNRTIYKRLLWFPIRIPTEPVIESLKQIYQSDSE